MSNNQGSSSNTQSTASLDPETRRRITLGLCEPKTAQMLTDAGRASQQARYVGGQKPVRMPVNSHNNSNAGNGK
ncbi:MAG: hypothetical protein L6R40_006803 [Gallowayella cf. fulva]|nr:MAG: hypothetical protein L6R40_006803 [Xanthomendoza cf. fulva]